MIQNPCLLNLPSLVNDIQTQFYAQVPFPLSGKEIDNAMEAFFTFLQEPDAVKSHLCLDIAPKHRRGDVGYQKRDPADHIYNDSKEFFHYHPALLNEYETFIRGNKALKEFMIQADSVWKAAYQVVHNILEEIEPSFPGSLAKVFDTDMPHFLLRFLKYEWQESGKYLAKPHFDAGSFTLAIAESCPGLRIGSHPEDLKLVKHHEGQGIFMLSSNFQKILPSNDLYPGWHDVIQLDETKIGKPFARWALVAFIDAYDVEALPRTETHKWYQG